MKQWITKFNQFRKQRLLAIVLAVALAGGFGAYEFAQPATANAAAVATVGTAAPIDESNVSALLALDHAMEALAARVTPAVVNVTVTARVKAQNISDQNTQGPDDDDDLQQFFRRFGFGQGPFRMMPQQPSVQHVGGSGVLVSPDGYIVTNNHVVNGATDIQVTMSNRRVLPAKLIGTDPITDLAVIKINGTNLPNVGWGDSTTLRPGQSVLAFGNPLGMRFTVTRGIISALNRTNPFSDDAHKPGQFIQTDAAINQGNSGGPLVDAHGQVIGINTFLISETGGFSGMGFAIPSQIAKPIVNTLIRDGKIEHGYMGVSITDVTPQNAKFFHMENASGAVISEVQPDSPGSRAGLKVGDVITAVDGQKVTDAGSLQAEVTSKKPGTEVKLELSRDGKTLTVPVTLEALNKLQTASASSASEHGKGRWGLGLENLTSDVRQQLNVPSNVQGAVIARVEPGSAADNAGLRSGLVIQQVNRKDVKSADEVKQALANIGKGQDALLLVWANGGSTFIVMHSPAESSNS